MHAAQAPFEVPQRAGWFHSPATAQCRPAISVVTMLALALLLPEGCALGDDASGLCALYPIAVSQELLRDVVPGRDLPAVFEGAAPGQFGWLSWSGSPSEVLLAQSLEPPGNSWTYVNPDHPPDNVLSPGDWVSGKPGVSNSRGVRDALDTLLAAEAVVPVWDSVRGRGGEAQYRVVSFARVRLLDYRLGGRGRITVRFLGLVDCAEANRAPVVDAGPDQTVWWGEPVDLDGAVHDDGLPPGTPISSRWSQVDGPGTAVFDAADALATRVQFDEPGTYRLRLEVSDSELTGADEVSVAVSQPNRPPAGLPMALELLEDGSLDIVLNGLDPDNDPLDFRIVAVPLRGTLTGDPPRLRYLPLPDFHGRDSFMFMVSDGTLNSAETVVDLIILPVNDAPIADGQAVTLLEDTAVDITLTGADLEGSPLLFRVREGPRHGTLTGTPPNVAYVPEPDFNGGDRFDFQVHDGELDSLPATVDIEVQPVNDPPHVSAGLDQAFYLDESGLIDGEVTDDGLPPGGGLGWHWSVVSGPGAAYLAQPESLSGQIRFDAPGVYVLRLTATDSALSAFDELTVTVMPRNQPPIVQAGADQLVAFPDPALLGGTALDDGLPEGGGLAARWEKADGPGTVIFSEPDALVTQARFGLPGRYRLRLWVTDSELSAGDDLEIVVNEAPGVNAGPDLIAVVGLPIQFRGDVQDDRLPADLIHSAWNRLEGPGPAFIRQPDALETEVTFVTPGEYQFRLTATDGHLGASDDMRVLVRPAGENLPPAVDAGRDRYIAGTDRATLSGNACDDGLPLGGELLVCWSVLDGPGEVEFDGTSLTNAVAQFEKPGVYELQLSASDGEFTVTDTVTLAVYPDNQPPVVFAGSDQTIGSGPAILTGAATDDGLPAGAVLSFRWAFLSGPGEVRWDEPDQPTARAGFSGPGVYTLRLTVSDSEYAASDEVIVTVTGNQAPWVDAGPDQLLDLFVPGQPPPSLTVYPPLPARWDYAVGQPGISGSWVRPNCLAASGTTLYVGGAFGTAGGVEVRSLARWDGCSYSALYDARPINPGDPNSAPIGFIAHHGITEPVAARGEEVFVAGGFLRDLDQDGFLDFTARWSGTGWEPWAFKMASAYVTARAMLATPEAVYFAGQFKFQTSNVPNAPVSFNVAKWNGQDWERLGDGIRDLRDTTERNSIQYGLVNALAQAPDGTLYVGGQFTAETPSGLAINLARWDGSAWAPGSPVALSGCQGTGCAPTIHGLAFDSEGELYVAGNFTMAAALDTRFIARWDGVQWWPVGDGMNHVVQALALHEQELYAGGEFSHAGSLPVNRLARWDGEAWHPLEHGVSGPVYAFASTPGGLYLGGTFAYANGQPSSLIAKWGHPERLSVTGPDPIVVPIASQDGSPVPLRLEIAHPCGHPLAVAWSVDGAEPQQIDQLGEGEAVIPVPLTFEHVYPPGVHAVTATLDDGVGDPVIFSTTVTVLTPATTTLRGRVRDDGLPVEGSLATRWSASEGAGPVLIQDSSQPVTAATFTEPGSYRLELVADDTALTAEDQLEIAVRPYGEHNLPPTAHAGRDRTVLRSESVTLSGIAIDDSLPGPPLQLDWTQLAGPAAANFESFALHELATEAPSRSTARNTTVTFPLPGQYRFRCVANDSQFTHADNLVVHVLDLVNQAPMVTAAPHQTVGLSAEAILSASAQDDGLPQGTLLAGWSQIAGPGGAVFHRDNDAWLARFSLPGEYVLRFTANDGALTAQAEIAVTVLADTPEPEVTLLSPGDGERVTAGCPISGAVAGDSLGTWRIVARPMPASATHPPRDSDWTVLAEGQAAAQGVLGQLDSTTLPNGLYELRLEATDQLGRSVSTDPIAITIEGQYKPGRFSLSFTDLSIPAAGLPIRVVRTYDSHRARLGQPGDFGVGWQLELNTVRVRKNRPLGRNWEQRRSGGWYELEPVRSREVVITFPDDRVLRFRARAVPDIQFGYPIATARLEFTPMPGTLGQLELDGSPLATVDGFTGSVDLLDAGALADFNPTRFRYTSPEGDVYVIEELDGLVGMSDRYGNTLDCDARGIHHSSGLSVHFLRDSAGYISGIVDPAGQMIGYDRDAQGNLSRVTARDGRVTRLNYNQAGWPHHLSRINDPLGNHALRTEYDDAGRMIRQIDAHGRAVEFERDLARRHELIRDRTGHSTLFEYDDRGNVTRRTDPLGAVTTFEYDDADHLLRRVDPPGRVTTFTYDRQFNLESRTDPLGRTSWFTYDAYRRLASVTDPRGFTTAFAHEPGRIRATDPAGHTTILGLDGAGLLASVTNAHGQVSRFEYDRHGRLAGEIDARGRITHFHYDDLGRPVRVETGQAAADGQTEWFEVGLDYDADGRITNAVAPDGAHTEQHYDEAGYPLSQVDPLGRATRFRHDPAGRLVQATFSDLAVVQFDYDPEGRLIALTNALGQVTRVTRDPLGRPVAVIHPDGAISSAQYDTAGNLVAVTDPRGASTLYGYDAAGQWIAVTNALGEVTRFEYDPNGNRTVIRNAAGHQAGFDYDPLNRLTDIRHPDGSTERFDYDATGQLVAVTDPAGAVTRFGYEPGGLLSSVTNAAGNVTRFEYDALGRCLRQIDAAGRVTRYQYDPASRLARRTLPNGESESFDYDAAGRLVAQSDCNGRITRFTYDALDLLIERLPDPAFAATPITYTYDAAGSRSTMTDGTGVTRYQYDAHNRRTAKSWQPAGTDRPLTIEYDYDSAGNLIALRSAHANGADVIYQYDALNRLSHVIDPGADADSPLTSTYRYDPAGDLASVTLGNGVLTTLQHDARHRLTNSLSRHPDAGAVAEFGYSLAPAGHRRSAFSAIAGTTAPRRHDYAYDSLHQLTAESIDHGGTRDELGYTYDVVGNRRSRTVAGPGLGALANTIHLYDANDQLVSDRYDANGNTIESRLPSPLQLPVTDLYDFENRLVQRRALIDGELWTIEQFHDGDGRLVAQAVNGSMTYYLVDDLNPTGHSQVIEELIPLSDTLTPTRVFTFGHALLHQQSLDTSPDQRFQWQLRFHGTDARGNVRYLTDQTGAVTDAWDYDAFGNVIERTGQSHNRHLFGGERWDPNLLMYDLRARYYQPDTGRFWTRDSFPGLRGDPSSLHPYLFAANDPVNRQDPTGHFSAVSMSLGVTYGLSLRNMYNGVTVQVGFGLAQALESLEAGRSDEQIVLDYFLASARDVALGFGTAYAARALWPALVRVASQPLASLSQTYSKSSAALRSWRNGSILSARDLLGNVRATRFSTADTFGHTISDPHAGIRNASAYLREMRIPRADRIRILESFDVRNMEVRRAGQSEFGLRYYSNPNHAAGSYLFETFPASREGLAIKPEWSSMVGFRQFQFRPGTILLKGRAASQGAYLPGGQSQIFILDWESDLISP